MWSKKSKPIQRHETFTHEELKMKIVVHCYSGESRTKHDSVSIGFLKEGEKELSNFCLQNRGEAHFHLSMAPGTFEIQFGGGICHHRASETHMDALRELLSNCNTVNSIVARYKQGLLQAKGWTSHARASDSIPLPEFPG